MIQAFGVRQPLVHRGVDAVERVVVLKHLTTAALLHLRDVQTAADSHTEPGGSVHKCHPGRWAGVTKLGAGEARQGAYLTESHSSRAESGSHAVWLRFLCMFRSRGMRRLFTARWRV